MKRNEILRVLEIAVLVLLMLVNTTSAGFILTWNTPSEITYGTALSSTQLNAIASVPGTFVYNPPAGTVLSVGTHTLYLEFTPSKPSIYNMTATKTIKINVVESTAFPKKTPIINWDTPSEITYGTVLNSAQFNAVAIDPVTNAQVDGNFEFSFYNGTILSGGFGHLLRVYFTPSDTANYNSVSKEATIYVLKATPTVTWNNPADTISGTALSSAQLNAIASVPGTFSYTPASGTILNAGTQVLHVEFTPSDSANYTTASKDATINVVAAPLKNPTITWSNPEDIISGTALSSTQLNATASVPGTFVYTPPSGTLLSAGTQTLRADFTPTDTANYNTASQNVTINVLTHVQGIQQITTEVQSLNLIPEQANLLTVKLDTATKNLNDGNTNAAANELNAFINQVNADINSGKISSTEGQTLIDEANALINAIDSHATSVPEFPSVVVPVAAILGLFMIFGHRKNTI